MSQQLLDHLTSPASYHGMHLYVSKDSHTIEAKACGFYVTLHRFVGMGWQVYIAISVSDKKEGEMERIYRGPVSAQMRELWEQLEMAAREQYIERNEKACQEAAGLAVERMQRNQKSYAAKQAS